jgi:hypothetical protein
VGGCTLRFRFRATVDQGHLWMPTNKEYEVCPRCHCMRSRSRGNLQRWTDSEQARVEGDVVAGAGGQAVPGIQALAGCAVFHGLICLATSMRLAPNAEGFNTSRSQIAHLEAQSTQNLHRAGNAAAAVFRPERPPRAIFVGSGSSLPHVARLNDIPEGHTAIIDPDRTDRPKSSCQNSRDHEITTRRPQVPSYRKDVRSALEPRQIVPPRRRSLTDQSSTRPKRAFHGHMHGYRAICDEEQQQLKLTPWRR